MLIDSGDRYEVLSADTYSPLYIEHLIHLKADGTTTRVLIIKNYYDRRRPLFTVPGDVISFSTYYNKTSRIVSCYALSLQEGGQLKLYAMTIWLENGTININDGKIIMVPPCG